MKSLLRWLAALVAVLLLAATGAGLWGWTRLHASLPQLDGRRVSSAIASDIVIERDRLGVPTIQAASRADAAWATGFLHAQDRFFQMDLLRRLGAGELAELIGPAALPTDRQRRLHRLRHVARQSLAQLPPAHAAILRAYVDGVNAGLAALRAPPPEYVLLRVSPQPWVPEDSFLVAGAMSFTLQDSEGHHERSLGAMRAALPPAAFAFFAPLGTEWDAAIDASVLPPAPVPGPDVLSFARSTVHRVHPPATNFDATASESVVDVAAEPSSLPVDEPVPGSNSWAVDGRRTAHGAALVANDMHLGLGVPTVWYRLRLRCPSAAAGTPPLDITGATLPGSPLVVVGSNGAIAWGFTNAALDPSDVIPLDLSPTNRAQYRTPDGWRNFEPQEETLRVRGGAAEILRVAMTIWGPVGGNGPGDQPYAVRWVTHTPAATNLKLIEMESAGDTAAALQLAPECGIPVMNFVVGDRTGAIGWTLCGRLPKRIGFDGRTPVSWADGSCRWDGLLPAEAYSRLVAPPNGIIWTANNRIAGTRDYLATGPWAVDLGARSRQIRDDLAALTTASPADMLRTQLDDRAVFLDRWQKLLLATLSQPALSNRSEFLSARAKVENWGGRAAPESSGYALVREFRSQAIGLVLEPLTAMCRERDAGFGYGFVQVEQPVWTLLQSQSQHLLNPRFASFAALLAQAAENAAQQNRRPPPDGQLVRWGERNRVAIRHPLSQAVPWLARWLDLAAMELPGDNNMPRVQGRAFGASERFAVAPGHEAEAYYHMPGGQSGHPRSPYYRAGSEAWAKGESLPFLPGAAEHRLVINAARPGP